MLVVIKRPALLREHDNEFDVNPFAIENDLGDEYNW
jgi:hypothetical protein